MVADRVREPGKVEPFDRHPLPIVRRVEHPVDLPLVGVGPGVRKEGLGLLDGGWESQEVQAQAADQRPAVGLGRGGEPALRELLPDEAVDRARGLYAGPGGIGLPRRDVGPVRLVDGALRDPAPDDLLVPGGEQMQRVGRRHHLGLVL